MSLFIGFLILSLVIIAGSILIVFLGIQLARVHKHTRSQEKNGPKPLPLVGNTSILRLCLEIFIASILSLAPPFYLGILYSLGQIGDQFLILLNIFVIVLFSCALFLMALWSAIRHDLPDLEIKYRASKWFIKLLRPLTSKEETQDSGSDYIYYLRSSIALAFTIFLAGCIIFYSVKLFFVFPGKDQALALVADDFLYSAISLAVVVPSLFLFLRGGMEIIRFIATRSYEAKVFARPDRHLRPYMVTLFLVGVLTLLLWGFGAALFFDKDSDFIYLSPTYQPPDPQKIGHLEDHPELASLIEQMLAAQKRNTSPIDRELSLTAWLSVPSVFVVIFGILISGLLRRLPNSAAILLAFLAALFGLWGLDIYSIFGGRIIYSLHNAAWLLVGPVMLHFVLIFPRPVETIPTPSRTAFRTGVASMYAAILILLPFWIYFHLTGSIVAIARIPTQPFLTQLLFLVNVVGLLTFPMSLAIGTYAIHKTRQGLAEAYKQLKPASDCLYQSIMLGRVDADRKQQLEQGQQFKLVQFGLIIMAVTFFVWQLFAPLFLLEGFSEWVTVPVRISFALFFLCITIALLKYRLWNVTQTIVHQFVWLIIILLSPVLYEALESYITSTIDEYLGTSGILANLLAFLGVLLLFIVAYIARLIDKLSTYAYRWFFRSKWEWQQNIKNIDLKDLPFVTKRSLLGILGEVLPNAASAAFLFWRTEQQQTYKVRELRNPTPCKEECEELLLNSFGGTSSVNNNYLIIPNDLMTALMEASGKRKAILINDLKEHKMVTRWDWLTTFLNFLDFKIYKRYEMHQTTIERLRESQLVLLLPIGSRSNNKGIIAIATDEVGDYYDARDQKTLGQFVDRLSLWSAGLTDNPI